MKGRDFVKKLRFSLANTGFSEIFGFSDEERKGRSITLISNLLASIYNVFITGIFYTGFLSMYDISITGVGIITFIPYIGNLFCVFSGHVLSKFKKRKAVLIAGKLYFYGMYILATTLMPLVITGEKARLIAFIVILFLAYAVYAPFAPGLTTWFYNFYPEDNQKRTKYISLLQLFASIMSSVTLMLSSVLADAVSNSPIQNELILGMRYLAFGLVAVEVFIQAKAKEYGNQADGSVKFKEIFTLPLKYKKFMKCMILMFVWNYIANLNNGLWSYHLLNHMKFSYTLINAMGVVQTVILLTTMSRWQRMITDLGWIRAFGLINIIWLPTEILFFIMSPETAFLFVPVSIFQQTLCVGMNLSYANILYMNLPEENRTTHIAYNSIGCNIFAFLGLLTGTYVSSLTGDSAVPFLGLNVYSIQFTTLMRAATQLSLGIILMAKWRAFTPDNQIREIEDRRQIVQRKRPFGRRV